MSENVKKNIYSKYIYKVVITPISRQYRHCYSEGPIKGKTRSRKGCVPEQIIRVHGEAMVARANRGLLAKNRLAVGRTQVCSYQNVDTMVRF